MAAAGSFMAGACEWAAASSAAITAGMRAPLYRVRRRSARPCSPLHAPGELRSQAEEARAEGAKVLRRQVAGRPQERAAARADLREGDARRHGDVEALGESRHGDAEAACARGERLGGRALVLVPEEQRDGPVRGDLRVGARL